MGSLQGQAGTANANASCAIFFFHILFPYLKALLQIICMCHSSCCRNCNFLILCALLILCVIIPTSLILGGKGPTRLLTGLKRSICPTINLRLSRLTASITRRCSSMTRYGLLHEHVHAVVSSFESDVFMQSCGDGDAGSI